MQNKHNLRNHYQTLGVINIGQARRKANRILDDVYIMGFASTYSEEELRAAYAIQDAIQQLEQLERKSEHYEYV